MSAPSSRAEPAGARPWLAPILIVLIAAALAYAIGARVITLLGPSDGSVSWLASSLVPTVVALWLIVRLDAPRGRLLLLPVVAVAIRAAVILGLFYTPSPDPSQVGGLFYVWSVRDLLEPLLLVAAALAWTGLRRQAPRAATATTAAGSAVVVVLTALLALATHFGDGDLAGGAVVLLVALLVAWLDRAALRAHPWIAAAFVVVTCAATIAVYWPLTGWFEVYRPID